MRKIYTCAIFLSGALLLGAQSKLDLTSQALLRNTVRHSSISKVKAQSVSNTAAVANEIGLIITLDDSAGEAALEEMGITIDTRIGNRVVANVPIEKIEELESCEAVKRISVTRKKKLLNDKARQACNVDDIHAGTGLPQAYTGKGVIVGLFDSGLDPNHINFTDADGNSRVQRLWSYDAKEYANGNVVVTENAYTTPEKIAAYTTDDESETHGTHVLGTIAGSYKDSNSQYYGVAPDADIAIACGYSDDASILKGVKRISDYAKSQGSPVVINLSLGDNIGPHDGTDDFTSALNDLAAKTPIILAAGNEADLPIAIVKTMTADDTQIRTCLTGTDALDNLNLYYRANYYAIGSVEIWCEDGTPFLASAAIVNKRTGAISYEFNAQAGSMKYLSSGSYVSAGDQTNTTFTQKFPDSYIGAGRGVDENSRRYYASFDFELERARTTQNEVIAIIVNGVAGKKYYMYNDGYYSEFTTNGLSGWDETTPDGTVSNMASGKNTIAVGAFVTRNKAPYTGYTLGEMADFSSYGTLYDGRELPHISAPGVALISSMSSYHVNSEDFESSYTPKTYTTRVNGSSYYWTVMGGTSMATPFVTGTMALWLQANPDLTGEELLDIAQSTAIAPATPSVQWGAGKIDAYAGLKKVLSLSGIDYVEAVGNESVLVSETGRNVYEVFAVGENAICVDVISINGATALSVNGSGDTAVVDCSSLTPGMYIIAVRGSRVAHSAKIVVK